MVTHTVTMETGKTLLPGPLGCSDTPHFLQYSEHNYYAQLPQVASGSGGASFIDHLPLLAHKKKYSLLLIGELRLNRPVPASDPSLLCI